MSRYLAIDYGLERSGLAVSDPDASMAFPLKTLYFRDFQKRGALFDELARISREEKIDEIIWGLPLGLEGQENLMCVQIRNAARRLARRIDLPYTFMPETLSSFEAERELQALGLKGAQLKKALDQQAACKILESYLRQKARDKQ